MYTDDDFCTLEPTKICDNCCKCLEAHEAYRVLHADMHIEELSAEEEIWPETYLQMQSVPFEEDDVYMEGDTYDPLSYDALEEAFEEEEYKFGKNLPPIEIDPALLAEWEAKLADIGKSEQKIPNLYGMRQRRNR